MLLKMEIFPVMGPSSVTPARQNKSPPHHKCMHIHVPSMDSVAAKICPTPATALRMAAEALVALSGRLGAAHDHVRASEPARLLPDSLRLQ